MMRSADLDNDGDMDLIRASTAASVYLNDGFLNFTNTSIGAVATNEIALRPLGFAHCRRHIFPSSPPPSRFKVCVKWAGLRARSDSPRAHDGFNTMYSRRHLEARTSASRV